MHIFAGTIVCFLVLSRVTPLAYIISAAHVSSMQDMPEQLTDSSCINGVQVQGLHGHLAMLHSFLCTGAKHLLDAK